MPSSLYRRNTGFKQLRGIMSASTSSSGSCLREVELLKPTTPHSGLPVRANTASKAAPKHPPCQSYILHNIYIGGFEGVTLLRADATDILPEPFSIRDIHPPDAIEIRNAGVKGYGMFARRHVDLGDVVLVEHPSIVVPYAVDLGVRCSKLYGTLLGRLDPLTLRGFMGLANNYPDCSEVEGILRTNGIAIELESSKRPQAEESLYKGIFLKASRCNHSCSPNAVLEWDYSTFSLSLSAVRPIRPGEEITVHYVPLDMSRQERRATLLSSYAFHCECHTCHASTMQSDLIRSELRQFWANTPSFEEWCLDPSLPDDALIRAHTRAMELIEQEGLQALRFGDHVDAVAMCYGALGDVGMFRLWVQRVRQVRVRRNPEQAIVFATWLSNPESFTVWGWRKLPVSVSR